MSKLMTSPPIVAIAVASVIAGVLVLLTSVAPPPAAAEPDTADGLVSAQTAAVSQTGRGCSVRSWPNYDQGCQFDLRPAGDTVRTVRIVDLEIRRNPGRAGDVSAPGHGP